MKNILGLGTAALLMVSATFSMLHAEAEKSNVGQPMPKLKIDYFKDKPKETAGKPMIVEFWATWCPPCRTSIPHLNELHKKFKDRGLVVIGVTDETNPTIRQFVKEVPMDYYVGTDKGGKLSEGFGVTGIPHALIVDKTGKIVWEGSPSRITDAEIEKVL